ncbi:MAG: neutral/alkaline non-lysosomal ceramidase N-terminal domain-containing protein [Kiritimatiellae bacterium]|nr:neutral/alkaline non-lysosomal ceramidase N-terminal domain-containing protein [Kiritimatiellia bacterium]
MLLANALAMLAAVCPIDRAAQLSRTGPAIRDAEGCANPSFSAGFARVDISPPVGHELSGYFDSRPASGVADCVEANAVVISDGTTRAMLVSCDLEQIKGLSTRYRHQIEKATGIPAKNVYIACTHSHTGPVVGKEKDAYEISMDGTDSYDRTLGERLVAAAKDALADLAPAEILLGSVQVPGVAFIRRYILDDGEVVTNPGSHLKGRLVGPAAKQDETLRVLRFRREGKGDIAVLGFATHADNIGGTLVSADWPGALRRETERLLGGGMRCVFFNGCEGDSNNTPRPRPDIAALYAAHKDDRFWKKDHIGRKLAEGAVSIWNRLERCKPAPIFCLNRNVAVPVRKPTAEELAKVEAGESLGRSPMISRVAAHRIRRMAKEPGELEIPVSVIVMPGVFVFAGLPGEPFMDFQRQVEASAAAKVTFLTCLTNGSYGYIPTEKAMREPGSSYETTSTIFAPGSADRLSAAIIEMISLK